MPLPYSRAGRSIPASVPRSLSVRLAASLGLAAIVLLSPMTAAAKSKPGAGSEARPAHADPAALMLDRFTFGPRPGDLDRVRAFGYKKWFEQQLSPDHIPDTALAQRLAAYPAMQMSQAEQIARYPTPSMVRKAAKTGDLPADPELRAIMADQVEFYQQRKDNKAAAAAPPALPTSTTPALATASSPVATTPQDLDRATEPLSKEQLAALLAMSPASRYGRMLHMSPAELIAARKAVHGDTSKLSAGMTPLQRETLSALAGTNRMISGELFSTRLLRDIYSERQLEAVMTDFWLNHFNIYIRKDGNMPSLLPEFQETVRAHALGHFEDLLVATAKSPAMLLYLDNAQSIGPDSPAANRPGTANAKKASAGLNENYARELMELHTLGVNGGYTQADVTEVARVFTGWGIERPGEGGEFVFNERRHEPGPKIVLGHTIPESGEAEGEQVLHLLATSPDTAHFLSLELAERFVSDTPPPALVDRMAKTFLKTNGDIKAVLRALVRAPEYLRGTTIDAKIKTPLELVTSAARATGADVSDPLPLAQSLERLGMPLYGCQPPTGYKWDAETWLNSAALVNRMNFALLFAGNKINGTTVDTSALIADAARSPRAGATSFGSALETAPEKAAALEFVLLPDGVSPQTRSAVLSETDSAVQAAMQSFSSTGGNRTRQQGNKPIVFTAARRDFGRAAAKPNAPPADQQAAVMLGLLLGSPEFQRH